MHSYESAKSKFVNINNNSNKCNFVEIGGGSGQLANVLINTLFKLKMLPFFNFRFVESSPSLRRIQQSKVESAFKKLGYKFNLELGSDGNYTENYQKFISTPEKIIVEWFNSIDTLSNYLVMNNSSELCPNIFFANELFDALPIYQFKYFKDKGWCEKLVLYDNENESLAFGFSKGPNENVRKILNPEKVFGAKYLNIINDGDCIEVSPDSANMALQIVQIIEKTLGWGLFIDYGDYRAFSESIRVIKKHQILMIDELLNQPGEVDASGFVNFKFITEVMESNRNIFVGELNTQKEFLSSMGLEIRTEAISIGKNNQEKKLIKIQRDRLMEDSQMGTMYKALGVFHKSIGVLEPFKNNLKQKEY